MKSPEQLHIGFAPYDLRYTFWAMLAHSLKQQATESGITLLTIPGSIPSEWIVAFETFLRQRVDVIITATSIDNSASEYLFQQTQALGISIIAIDSPFPITMKTHLVRSDHVKGATLVTEQIVARMGGRGKLVHLQGDMNSYTATQRSQAVRAIAARYPDVEIVFEADADWQRAEGARSMRSALAQHPDVRGVVAGNDYIALGALDVIAEHGLTGQILVGGFDAQAEVLRAIHTGAMAVTVQQQPEHMARAALNLALQSLAGVVPPTEVVTDVALVDADNLMDVMLETVDFIPLALHDLVESTQAQSQLQQEVITSQQELIRRLTQSEERFAKMFYSSLIGKAIVALPEGEMLYVNQSYLDMMQYRREDIIGKTMAEVGLWASAADRDRVVAMIQQQQSIHDVEFDYRMSTGEIRTALASIERIELDGRPCLLAMSQDITTRKRTEAALRDSEESYRLITENASDLIAMLDFEGRFVYASPSHWQALGRSPIELLGMLGTDLAHPDDLEAIRQATDELRTASKAQVTFRYHHTDGSWRWLEASASTLMRDDAPFIVSVARDVTRRKQLEAQLLQAQRMESIGRLAGGVAHDFNNVLTVISGYTELALTELPPDHPIAADLNEIRKGAARATDLTRQLLAFARKQIIEPRILSLNDLIIDMDRMLRRLIGEDIELVTLPAPDLWSVKVDLGQIEQVLVNLAVNARDAMPEGGRLTIETQNVMLDAGYTQRHANVVPGSYVMLAVSDTGTGMSSELQAHAFEPFFTTKEVGKGTGLGLATCYGIIKQHGGNIWVYSEEGQGTTFKIYLPQADAPAEDLVRLNPAATLPRGRETVLVVEDEDAVRGIATRVLRDQGYTVLEATRGIDALQLAQSHDGGIQLLLTDVVMPHMSGKVLAKQLVHIYPHVKVLFMSGYTDNAIVHHGQLDAGIAFLQKPFTPDTLAHKVREVLDAPAS